MPNLVNLESVRVEVGHRLLLDRVSIGVQTDDRIGILGLNGSGKSTLLRTLGGLRPPTSGRVSIGRGVEIAIVAQAADFPAGATVRQLVLGDVPGGDHHWAADAAIRAVLDGLGLTAIGLDVDADQLSGGERRRVALASALTTDADLVLLDEPTNHLDIEGIAWLAAHLQNRPGACVVVTHDRWFLDAVATLTWEVVDTGVLVREGGFSDWVFARAERFRLGEAAEERRRNLARKELAWLRRGPPARTSKPRYRIAAAEALIADLPAPRESLRLEQFPRHRLGKDVLGLEDVSADTGPPEYRPMLSDVTWRIGPGDRVAIVGANGSGKTTLLRVLLGMHPRTAGSVERGVTVRVGYLSQEVSELPGELRLLESVTEIARVVNLGGRELTAGQLCERFGFGTQQQWTFVRELSGGERRRLQLLRLLMTEPNVLVLDEPTNDLDLDTLQAIEDLLDQWPGTLLLVSHDRYFVERVSDDVVATLGDSKVTHMVGGIDEYLSRRAALTEACPTSAPVPRRSADATQQRLQRKELQRLERLLESLERKQRSLATALAEVGSDYARAAELDAELTTVRSQRDEIEGEWLVVAEEMEG